MTKKFIALTMVLVLVAGAGAFAAEQDQILTGTWENTVSLTPQATSFYWDGEELVENGMMFDFMSTLDVEYIAGGITYSSISEFGMDGYVSQSFGVDTTIGMLDLGSTAQFSPADVALDFWKTDATLTLGGVSISDTFLLQRVTDMEDRGMDDYNLNDNDEWAEPFGAGMDLAFTGETPGGVSVAVNNYFGMEPVDVAVGEITGQPASLIAQDSGYRIVTEGFYDNDELVSVYNPSSLQYVATKLTLDAIKLGHHEFSNETLFSELHGFEYTQFDFTIEAVDFPMSLDGYLRFTPQTKSAGLTPTIDFIDFVCTQVYMGWEHTDYEFSGFTIDGFAFKDIQLGHVTFSDYVALGGNTLADLPTDAAMRGSYDYFTIYEDEEKEDVAYTYTEYFNQLMRIEKVDAPLEFTADTYFDMGGDAGLFDLALIELSSSFDLSDQFSLGSGILVSPKGDVDVEFDVGDETGIEETVNAGGLQEFSLSFDYSF